ncbi:TolC family protein, partial [Sphingobium indicum]
MRRVFVLTLTSFLGACQLAPPHARPALPTTRDYPTSYAGDGVLGRRAVEISWREFFADPQLETLIATALERNRDLAVAVAQIQEARGLYRIQGAERLPALGANGDVTRSRTPGSAIGIPEVGAITDTRYSIGVGVTGFELDFWGRVRN